PPTTREAGGVRPDVRARGRRWSAGRRSAPAVGLASLPHVRRARLGAGFATLSSKERRAVPPDRKGGQRGLASPWRLPALHSPFGETEKGTPAYPGPSRMRVMV